MNFPGPVLAWLTLALLPIILPLFLAVIIRRVMHVQSGCLVLVVMVVVGLLSAFGIAAYLDSGGLSVRGELLDKRESIIYHLDGSWDRKMVADISYRPSDTAAPITTSLDLLPARFDELNQGDFVELRCPAEPRMFQVVRLEDQQTYSQVWFWLTNQPFLSFFVLGLLFVLVARFMLDATLPTLFFLTGLVTIGSWWMASVGVPLFEQASALLGSLNSANAIVREIHPPYLGEGLQGWISTKLFTQSDLILLDVIPVGRSAPILSVDQVDLGSASLAPGQGVTVEYSTGNPRFSIVPDASRSYLWKNGLLNTLVALLAMLGVAKVSFMIRHKTQAPRGKR
jgi:hypothetical protein